MAKHFRTADFQEYTIDYSNPFVEVESKQAEIETVDRALDVLEREKILSHTGYPRDLFESHRKAVRECFEVPWTAITPRMERLIYAVNAITQPAHMIAAGVFCGFTFICNAGAGAGPGACYEANDLVGVEIQPEEAERAKRNVRRLDGTGTARIITGNATDVVSDYSRPIELLYLDADGGEGRGKGIYLDILRAGYHRLPEGAVVMAHNSYNCRERLEPYLEFVRNADNFSASVNILFDSEGLEISAK